jgi:hypothetical protein
MPGPPWVTTRRAAVALAALFACGGARWPEDFDVALARENRGPRLDGNTLRAIHIERFRVVDLEVDQDREVASITLELVWRHDADEALHTSAVRQKWRLRDGRWALRKEWQIGGELMPTMLERLE